MEIVNIIFESDAGYTIDVNNCCYDKQGNYIFKISAHSMDIIKAGYIFGGMYWKPVNFSLENE